MSSLLVPSPGGVGASLRMSAFTEDGPLVNHTSFARSLNNDVANWPSANRAIYWPFYLRSYAVFSKFWVCHGSPVTGNIDMGVFAEDGTKLVSTGSTAAAGSTFTIQDIDVTDFALSMGMYYFGISSSSASTNLYCATWVTTVNMRIMGFAQEASALPLPSTMTPANPASAYIPQAGLLAA